MPSGGAGPDDALAEQVTFDGHEDWFHHLAPDGRRVVWTSFPAYTEGHDDKMPGMQLRTLALDESGEPVGEPEVLATFFGGQGTINANSWAPDSSQFAFVAYELGD